MTELWSGAPLEKLCALPGSRIAPSPEQPSSIRRRGDPPGGSETSPDETAHEMQPDDSWVPVLAVAETSKALDGAPESQACDTCRWSFPAKTMIGKKAELSQEVAGERGERKWGRE